MPLNTVACLYCTDGMVVIGAPFIFHWMIAFYAWVAVGLSLAAVAQRKHQHLPVPVRNYAFAAAAGIPLLFTGGVSLLMIILLPCWLRHLWREVRLQDGHGSRHGIGQFAGRANNVFLAVCAGLVPVSYARLFYQFSTNTWWWPFG